MGVCGEFKVKVNDGNYDSQTQLSLVCAEPEMILVVYF